MTDPGKKHRVIGIRHVLRHLKKAGLIETETLYASGAVSDVQDEVLSRAITWYKIGARRGALEILDAFLDGKFTVRSKPGGSREIVANVEKVQWHKKLKVRVGNSLRTVEKSTYRLPVKKLEFE
jgi:hypothetical protein